MGKFSIIAAALLLGASSVMAQTQGGLNEKSKFLDDNKTAAVKLDMVSVTANKSETDVAKYVGQVGILNEDDLAKTQSVIDAIGQLSGVQIGDDFGRQAGQQFRIRGFGYQSENRVIIEQDGIKRSPSLYSNQISTFRVDNDLLKRVEVVKGASSVLHGSGAIGGIVSMKTKGVDDFIIGDKNYGVMIGHRQESNHMNAQRAAIAVKPAENFGFLLYGKHADHGDIKLADGGNGVTKKTENKERINTFLGKIEWDIADEHRLEASLYNYHENLRTGWQSLWRPSPEPDAPVIGKIKQRDYSVTYKFDPVNNPWINFLAQYYNTEASYHRTMKGVIYNPTQNVDSDYLNKDKRWGINLKNESLFETFGAQHRLVVGGEYEKRRESGYFTTITGVQDMNSHPALYNDYGFYAQDILSVGNFEFTLGGRYDRFERKVNRDGRPKYTESRFSPKFSAAYEVFEGVNLLAGYAETFRAPTPHETSSSGPINPVYWYVPNTNLKPELAKEYELGFSVNRPIIGDDNLYLKATYYKGKIKDMIAIRARDDMGTPPVVGGVTTRRYAQYDNISQARRYGYEVDARYDIANFIFNFAYDHTKVYNARTKARINVYADKLTLGAKYRYEPWRLTAGFDVAHYLTPNRDVKTVVQRGVTYEYVDQSFTIVNFKGAWQPRAENKIFGEGFKINFGVNNIFDKKYIHPDNYKNSASTGKGRNFYVDFEKIF